MTSIMSNLSLATAALVTVSLIAKTKGLIVRNPTASKVCVAAAAAFAAGCAASDAVTFVKKLSNKVRSANQLTITEEQLDKDLKKQPANYR